MLNVLCAVLMGVGPPPSIAFDTDPLLPPPPYPPPVAQTEPMGPIGWYAVIIQDQVVQVWGRPYVNKPGMIFYRVDQQSPEVRKLSRSLRPMRQSQIKAVIGQP